MDVFSEPHQFPPDHHIQLNLSHICIFLAIFAYKPPNPGLNHRYTFNAQLSCLASLNQSHSVFTLLHVNSCIQSTNYSCFSLLR